LLKKSFIGFETTELFLGLICKKDIEQ
jgi:hypothetical protein